MELEPHYPNAALPFCKALFPNAARDSRAHSIKLVTRGARQAGQRGGWHGARSGWRDLAGDTVPLTFPPCPPANAMLLMLPCYLTPVLIHRKQSVCCYQAKPSFLGLNAHRRQHFDGYDES